MVEKQLNKLLTNLLKEFDTHFVEILIRYENSLLTMIFDYPLAERPLVVIKKVKKVTVKKMKEVEKDFKTAAYFWIEEWSKFYGYHKKVNRAFLHLMKRPFMRTRTIYRNFKVGRNLPCPCGSKEEMINVKELYKIYESGKTLEEIGSIVGVNGRTIGRWFEKHNFNIRTKSEAKRGKFNGSFHGNPIITKDGYVEIWDGNKRILEHRFVMENYISRPLKDNIRRKQVAKQLKKTLDDINSEYGEGTIMELGQKENIKVDYIKTGVECIDKIIGDGIPTGRIIELFGEESCGKTTLCLKIIAEVQKKKPCAFVDLEHSLDLEWCAKLGVNTDELILTQPDYGEQALDIVERLIHTEKFGVIVLDSVAGLVPKSELEGEFGDANIGKMARLMSQAMRKLRAALAKSKTILIFTNQQRDKIGVLFGNPKVTCGGNALKYYASVRLMLTRKELIKDKKVAIGTNVRAKCIKNKVSNPFAECIFQINFDGTIKEIR